jgi:hypothetical protein
MVSERKLPWISESWRFVTRLVLWAQPLPISSRGGIEMQRMFASVLYASPRVIGWIARRGLCRVTMDCDFLNAENPAKEKYDERF